MVVRDCSDVHKRNLRVDVLGDTRGQQLVVDSPSRTLMMEVSLARLPDQAELTPRNILSDLQAATFQGCSASQST